MNMLSTAEIEGKKVDYLKKVSLFKSLLAAPEAFVALAELMKVRSFEKGKTLLQEGEVGDEFFVLLSGSVSVYRKTAEGELYKVAILHSEKTPALGEGGLVEAEPRSATVVCDESCQFLVLNREGFAKFCEKSPNWAVPILKQIATQLMSRVRQVSQDVMLLHKALMNEIRG